MELSTDQIVSLVESLPRNQQADVLDRLLVSIREPDPELDELWKAEIQRRVEEVKAGRAKLIPGEEVFAKIHERLGR